MFYDGGGVVELVTTSACHAEGREFESRRSRHSISNLLKLLNNLPWANGLLVICTDKIEKNDLNFCSQKEFGIPP